MPATGHIVTMLSSFGGIVIVTLPAGIITAGYMDEIKNERGVKREKPQACKEFAAFLVLQTTKERYGIWQTEKAAAN